jgi:putative DNA primase/helicase
VGSLLGWTAPRAHKVLYLDGELRREAVAGRLRLFGPPPPSLRLWLAAEQRGSLLDLATENGILRLMAGWGDVDLVVVDSLSSLAGISQDDPEGWTLTRRFLAHQRNVGRAVLLVHHANRDGALRGTSRRLDMMDLVMALRRPRDWQPADGARFELRLEKTRHRAGEATMPIEAQLCPGADGRARWEWHRGESRALRQAPLLQQGMSAEAVGKAIGVSARTAYRLQRRAKELGWIGSPEIGSVRDYFDAHSVMAKAEGSVGAVN